MPTANSQFEQPDVAILEVLHEFSILMSTHVARPHHPRSVDVGSVVDPFVVHIVSRTIAHKDDMATTSRFQVLTNLISPLDPAFLDGR